jgi:hypothetical protein
MEGAGIKKNDGRGEFNYDIVRTFINVTMYNMIKKYNKNQNFLLFRN